MTLKSFKTISTHSLGRVAIPAPYTIPTIKLGLSIKRDFLSFFEDGSPSAGTCEDDLERSPGEIN